MLLRTLVSTRSSSPYHLVHASHSKTILLQTLYRPEFNTHECAFRNGGDSPLLLTWGKICFKTA